MSTDHATVVPLDGTAEVPVHLLGRKAFGLNAMRWRGLPVPPAFCLTTDVCMRYAADPHGALDAVWQDVRGGIGWLEAQTSRTFGAGPAPLLLSVRSGAAASMPGMLDTVLNLGIDAAVEVALIDLYGAAFARETRDRFRKSLAHTAFGETQAPVPDDPYVQLRLGIGAVLASWNSPRALAYRSHHGIDEAGGTAVVVQAMVFGNADDRSGSGVLFTRNPITGSGEPFGDWLPGGQGEEVVSGAVSCAPVAALGSEQPAVYAELLAAAHTLERAAAEVQEIEFTVESARLWLLQTRTAHLSRTPKVVSVAENHSAATLLATGAPACPGVAVGTAYIDVDAAIDAAERGEDVILVRRSTSPHDVPGMLVARGVVTEVGGASSHAAVLSRELGLPAVVGCGAGVADALAGKRIAVDGTAGQVWERACDG